MKRLLSAVYSVDPLLLLNTSRVTVRRGIPEGLRSQMPESEWCLVPEALTTGHLDP